MMLRRARKGPPEIPAASLADVAFLLLVFFISTTVFDREEGLPMTLPGRAAAVVQMRAQDVLRVTSDEAGNVFMDERRIEIDELAPTIRERLTGNADLVVSIESHPESRYEVLVQILDEVKKANATRISLKMRPV